MSFRCLHFVLALALVATAAVVSSHGKNSEKSPVPTALNFMMNSLDGKPVNLAKYHGKVVLMVNVASKCGYTPQYKALQALHDKYKDKGLAILGFPANNFGDQEPGSDSDIASFCTTNYGVKFDMFSKVSVKGDDICPLYKYLTTSQDIDEKHRGEVKWNFEKFLIGRNGKVINRFRSKVEPDSKEMIDAIEAELAKKSN